MSIKRASYYGFSQKKLILYQSGEGCFAIPTLDLKFPKHHFPWYCQHLWGEYCCWWRILKLGRLCLSISSSFLQNEPRLDTSCVRFLGCLLLVEILNLTVGHTAAAQLGSTSLARAHTYGWVHGGTYWQTTLCTQSGQSSPSAILQPSLSWNGHLTRQGGMKKGAVWNHWCTFKACFVWQVGEEPVVVCGSRLSILKQNWAAAAVVRKPPKAKLLSLTNSKTLLLNLQFGSDCCRCSPKQFESKTFSHPKVQLPLLLFTRVHT